MTEAENKLGIIALAASTLEAGRIRTFNLPPELVGYEEKWITSQLLIFLSERTRTIDDFSVGFMPGQIMVIRSSN